MFRKRFRRIKNRQQYKRNIKSSHLSILIDAILCAMGLCLGIFLALVMGGKAIVVMGKVIHRLLVLEEGRQCLTVGVVVRRLAISERSVQIVQIKVGNRASGGCTLCSSAGSATSGSSVISGVGRRSTTNNSVLPTALPTTKVPSAVVAETDPAEMMPTLASHVIAAAILFDLHLALGTVLDGRARLAAHTTEQIIIGVGIGVCASLTLRMGLLAALEAKGCSTGTT